MKSAVIVMLLLPFAYAKLDATLSILPDLAFFFQDGNGALYDTANWKNITKIVDLNPASFFPGIPNKITAAAYLKRGPTFQTAFFRAGAVFVVDGDKTEEVKGGVKSLFTGDTPTVVEVAFPRVNQTINVVGTNFISHKSVYECGSVGSACTVYELSKYFPGLSSEFIQGGPVQAALGLPNGRTILLKETVLALIDNDGNVEEDTVHNLLNGGL